MNMTFIYISYISFHQNDLEIYKYMYHPDHFEKASVRFYFVIPVIRCRSCYSVRRVERLLVC